MVVLAKLRLISSSVVATVLAVRTTEKESAGPTCTDFQEVKPGDKILERWRETLSYEPHLKAYKSQCMTAAWNQIAVNTPPATPAGTTFTSAIKTICEGEGPDCTVVLHGGAVRDLMHGLQPKDIDLAWSTDTEKLMKKMMGKGFEIAPSSSLEFSYLKFGHDVEGNVFEPLEGNGFRTTFRGSPCEAENDVNSLLYDPVSGYLIDPDGHGVVDNLAKEFRIPEGCTDVKNWMSNGRKTALRYFKMIEKGYSDVDADRGQAWLVVAAASQKTERGQQYLADTYSNFMSQMGPTNGQKYQIVEKAIDKVFPPSLLRAMKQGGSAALLEKAESVWEAREV